MRKRSTGWKVLEFLFMLLFLALVGVILHRASLTSRRDAEQKAAAADLAKVNAEVSAGAEATEAVPEETPTAAPTPEPTDTPAPTEAPTETPEPTEAPAETPEVTEDPEPDATEFSQVAADPTPKATKKAKKNKKKANATAKPTAVPEPRNTPNPDMLKEAQEKLKENSDYVGMLGVGDQAMYVCQADDNTYYAEHRFDRETDKGGMIYMDCRCDSWPLSDNTVLYGHNMRDGTRFGQLQHFLDPNYIDEHPYVQFATLYNVRKYAPISIMRLSIFQDHEDYLEFDHTTFDSETEFNVYVEGIRARSILRLNDVDVKYGDHLLTLATCSEAYDGGRLVIVCVEVED